MGRRKRRMEDTDSTTRTLRKLSGEARVRLAAEMSSTALAITLDSILDQNPGLSRAQLIQLAHKRLRPGSRAH